MAQLGHLQKTLQTVKQWRGLLGLKGLVVVAAIDIMHHWPGRHPLRRIVRLFCRHRRFSVTLKRLPHCKIAGRYDEYADYHAICEIFFDRVYNFNLLSVPPSMIIDAGGHIGTFSLLAGQTFPNSTILTFEPDPQNFALLELNLKHNNSKAKAMNVALADFEGSTLLEGASTMGRHIEAEHGTPVQVRRLSQIAHFDPEANLLMKVDVEGAEWRVLNECVMHLPINTFIYIETHGGEADLHKLVEFCARWKFQHEHTNAKGEYHESILRRGIYAGGKKTGAA